MVTKTDSKEARVLNKLISEIPSELLANKDLVFIVNDADAPDEPCIDIKLRTRGYLADLAYIGSNSEGTVFHAGFLPGESGQCDVDDETGDEVYCPKASYIKEAKFVGMPVCPHVVSCGKVETFIQKYAKKHNIAAK